MSTPVTIDNEFLSLDVWPQVGGKVSSMIDKADGYDLLFSYPAEIPTRCQYGLDYSDAWSSGWDECFPSIAPCPYPLHPYEGINIPDHGEIWSLPTTAVPNKAGITTVWHGLRFGYRFTRKLFLDGPSVCADYTLVNLAPFEFRFIWSLHALFSTTSPTLLDVPGEHVCTLRDDADTLDKFTWPMLGDLHLDEFGSLPPGRSWKTYTTRPIHAPARLTYPQRRRTLQVEYLTPDNPAYWGAWVNTGHWAGHRTVGIEVVTGKNDRLDRAITDNSAARVPASGKIEWSAKMTVGAF